MMIFVGDQEMVGVAFIWMSICGAVAAIICTKLICKTVLMLNGFEETDGD